MFVADTWIEKFNESRLIIQYTRYLPCKSICCCKSCEATTLCSSHGMHRLDSLHLPKIQVLNGQSSEAGKEVCWMDESTACDWYVFCPVYLFCVEFVGFTPKKGIITPDKKWMIGKEQQAVRKFPCPIFVRSVKAPSTQPHESRKPGTF